MNKQLLAGALGFVIAFVITFLIICECRFHFDFLGLGYVCLPSMGFGFLGGSIGVLIGSAIKNK